MTQSPEPESAPSGQPAKPPSATSATSTSSGEVDLSTDLASRRQKALKSCDDQIDFFKRAARKAHWSHAAAQVVTIVLTAAIPIILLGDSNGLPPWLVIDVSAKMLAAVLSALVAIAAGMAGAFHWQEAWIRTAFFTQRLTSERQQYEVRAGDYGRALSEEEALDTFMTRTEALRMAEAGQWREREQTVARERGAAPDHRQPQHPDTHDVRSPTI